MGKVELQLNQRATFHRPILLFVVIVACEIVAGFTNEFTRYTKKFSSRMRTARLETGHGSVATTRCR